jgi:hypothetical protein
MSKQIRLRSPCSIDRSYNIRPLSYFESGPRVQPTTIFRRKGPAESVLLIQKLSSNHPSPIV